MQKVNVIGAGLAGVETAYFLATHGIKVKLFDIKPKSFTPAHTDENFAELVCSNSLKSNDIFGNAAGLLKEEMRRMGSITMSVADKTRVPAGNALAVNRVEFAKQITDRIKAQENIEIVCEEVTKIPKGNVVIATGPLTTKPLSDKISELVGEKLHFFDASAPIVEKDSIDFDHAFYGDRYGKGNGDHVNCPMNKEEYVAFIEALTSAERATLHDFENKEIFEGCMPIEIMASRGKDTLRFGPLKPVGLDDPKTGRWPYACLQLRREDENGEMYNLVGFQTNLTFAEQKRVFGIIPALKQAEYLRYGVMHRNTFINSPEVLNPDYSLKADDRIYFAGQITGVEGYVESALSGLMAGIYIWQKLSGKLQTLVPEYTVAGALAKYITTPNKDFQPMNANFGILPPMDRIIKDKAQKKHAQAERSLLHVDQFVKETKLWQNSWAQPSVQ
ncbi:MAG: methylenetetrahydrofolate--tRNA-(uracil(54)-C(5))-methyltransferase (FADH(2)-oxidizing) TrmFO [Clostridiales bacterium]|nr:methylenetetrahydrofolate--tRNA-(uracil(54)-C(5))-methyltransferase (FADH(2)-oxidizing) TrmFO [Clostridiales bacterium]